MLRPEIDKHLTSLAALTLIELLELMDSGIQNFPANQIERIPTKVFYLLRRWRYIKCEESVAICPEKHKLIRVFSGFKLTEDGVAEAKELCACKDKVLSERDYFEAWGRLRRGSREFILALLDCTQAKIYSDNKIPLNVLLRIPKTKLFHLENKRFLHIYPSNWKELKEEEIKIELHQQAESFLATQKQSQ